MCSNLVETLGGEHFLLEVMSHPWLISELVEQGTLR